MKKLTVLSCRECPFVRDIPILGGLLRVLNGNEPPKSGQCGYDAERNEVRNHRLGLPPGPEREAELARWKTVVNIEDRDQIPEKCPLRVAPVIVSLGS